MRLTLPVAATAVAASAALVATLAPSATADTVLAPRTTFTMPVNETNGTVTLPDSGEGIPNVDSVKSTIRKYYNATGGLANRTTSSYIDEVSGIEDDILDSLPDTAPAGSALVFDTDDTLLWNYDYEDKGSSFNYDPVSNAAWVTGKNADGSAFDCAGGVKTGSFCFPAVPGMPDVLQTLADEGYALYVVTGRPIAQQQATIDNLTAAGFVDGDGDPLFTTSNVFAKDVSASWLNCTQDGSAATSCSTVEWKAQTRKHIEAGADGTFGNGDDLSILANVGDQLSDLWGGYTAANAAVKIPNPTYFLSSPDLVAPGPNDQAAGLTAPDTYTMAPDGSSGLTEKGDGIPNIDPVRTEIRAYYNATNGIANKSTSPYITELKGLEATWTKQIVSDCLEGTAAIDTAKAKIAAAHTAVTAADRAVAAADKAIARATSAFKKARRHHQPVKARKAKKAKQAAMAARRSALAAKAAANRVLATTKVPGKPAAVFDADDTTLMTYDMEDGAMKFVFNPTVQDTDWVQPQKFPATPGMPELVADVADAGCTVFGLTGRSDAQKYATLGNLAKVGYSDFRANNYYTKWNSGSQPPAYIDCGSDNTCSTIEYKSGTRKYIEEQRGFDIVANLGDQFSDLIGGHADKTYKLPNPTYYLP
jgi:predicted secreted acid phosphatase